MCSKDFIARKTTSKTCSVSCAKRFYKLKIKNNKIAQVELQTAIKKAPKIFLTEEQISYKCKAILNVEGSCFIIKYLCTHFKKMDFGWKDAGYEVRKEMGV